MPVFLVTYTTPQTSEAITFETEWVCDASYDRDRACEAFNRQFTSASIIHVQEVSQ
jgi:hypothetical protein